MPPQWSRKADYLRSGPRADASGRSELFQGSRQATSRSGRSDEVSLDYGGLSIDRPANVFPARPGVCFKVFTRARERNDMPNETEPEILRTPLETLFLQVKAIRADEDVNVRVSWCADA